MKEKETKTMSDLKQVNEKICFRESACGSDRRFAVFPGHELLHGLGGIWYIPGIVIGCIGIAGEATAYPIYKHLVKQDREKIAPEILRLSEELIQGEISEWSF